MTKNYTSGIILTMKALIVALQNEAQSVIENLENKKELTIIGKKAYQGTINGENVVLAISGIGKVNSAITTQALIDNFNPTCIINFGSAGGVDNSVKTSQFYQIENCCQFDFDLRDIDNVPLGYIQDYDTCLFPCKVVKDFLEVRNLASADRFTESELDNQSVRDVGASIRDMEGGAIAQTCLANQIPLYSIKGITDITGSGSTAEQFKNNLISVCKNFYSIIEKLIEKI